MTTLEIPVWFVYNGWNHSISLYNANLLPRAVREDGPNHFAGSEYSRRRDLFYIDFRTGVKCTEENEAEWCQLADDREDELRKALLPVTIEEFYALPANYRITHIFRPSE